VSLPGGPSGWPQHADLAARGGAHGQNRGRGDDRGGHAHRGVLEVGRPEPNAPRASSILKEQLVELGLR
jgi:hypothetical protein